MLLWDFEFSDVEVLLFLGSGGEVLGEDLGVDLGGVCGTGN